MKAKGFTLIELLVVITIIGILATGATAIYSTAQEKSRDAVRITDIQAVSTGVQQAYTDDNAYPADAAALIAIQAGGYIANLPTDPKTGTFDYSYDTAANAGGVADQDYEVATLFENAKNTANKAAKDEGSSATYFELGTKKSIATEGAAGSVKITGATSSDVS